MQFHPQTEEALHPAVIFGMHLEFDRVGVTGTHVQVVLLLPTIIAAHRAERGFIS